MNEELCRGCGCPKSDWQIKEGVLTCPFCGNRSDEVLDLTKEVARKLDEASRARDNYDFAKSLSIVEELLSQDPNNVEANWYALLAYYKIVYTKNGSGKYVPTFLYADKGGKISQSKYYAGLSEKRKKDADAIEDVRVQAVDEYKKIKPYDVFISYKQHDDKSGKLTQESAWARDIYEELKGKYRVFYDEKSLSGSNVGWEPHIYAALRTAKVMVLLGSSLSNINATWVKNEWKRFLSYKNDGDRKEIIVLGGFDVDPSLLPDEAMTKKQMISQNEDGWCKKVVNRVQEALGGSLGSTIVPQRDDVIIDDKKNQIVTSVLQPYKFDETVNLSLDTQLDLIEDDLDSNLRSQAVKQLAKLKAEQRPDQIYGRILLLELLVKYNLRKVSELYNTQNIEQIEDLKIFETIFGNAYSEKLQIQVLDLLYNYVCQSDRERKIIEILNLKRSDGNSIVLNTDYRKRHEVLRTLLQKSEKNIYAGLFDILLPYMEFDTKGDINERLKIAENAFSKRNYGIAKKYAERILKNQPGNVKAKDILLLSTNSCGSYKEFFSASRIESFAWFDELKDILAYLPQNSERCSRCGGEYINVGDGKYVCPNCNNTFNQLKDNYTDKLDSWNKCILSCCFDCSPDALFEFYDEFLTLYHKNERYYRVQSIAEKAMSKRQFGVAQHYFNFMLEDTSNKASIYWKMMLCDLNCRKEEELYALMRPISDSSYFNLAYGESQGAFKEHIQKVRKRQLEAFETNRIAKQDAIEQTKRLKRSKKIVLSCVFALQILLALTMGTVVLSLLNVHPFCDFWSVWALQIFKELWWQYILIAVLGVMMITLIVMPIKHFRQARHFVFMSIALILLVLFVGSGIYTYTQQAKEDKKTAENVVMAIENLGDITLNSEEEILEVEGQYEALTWTQKKYVVNYDALREARDKYSGLTVNKRISELQEISLESINIIDDIEEEYNLLNENAKKYVLSYSLLLTAKEKYYNLLIPVIDNWLLNFNTLDNDSIRTLLEFDNRLSSIPNTYLNQLNYIGILDSIHNAYRVYVSIENIGEVSLDSKEKIKQVETAFNLLNNDEQMYVSNQESLFSALARYEYLSNLTYTIHYNSNGGEGEMKDIVCKYGESVKLADIAFSKFGYTAIGWALNSNSREAEFSNNQTVINLTDIDQSIVNLYVVWEGWQFNIHLVALSFTIRDEKTPNFNVFWDAGTHSQTVTYGERVALRFPYTMLEYADWYVEGWYTEDKMKVYDRTSGIVPGVEGYTSADGKWIITHDVTLYGYWDKK